MERKIEEFISYLHNIKKTSTNTELSYRRDLNKFGSFLQKRGIERPEDATEADLHAYMEYLEKEHFAAATVSRSIAQGVLSVSL